MDYEKSAYFCFDINFTVLKQFMDYLLFTYML